MNERLLSYETTSSNTTSRGANLAAPSGNRTLSQTSERRLPFPVNRNAFSRASSRHTAHHLSLCPTQKRSGSKTPKKFVSSFFICCGLAAACTVSRHAGPERARRLWHFRFRFRENAGRACSQSAPTNGSALACSDDGAHEARPPRVNRGARR